MIYGGVINSKVLPFLSARYSSRSLPFHLSRRAALFCLPSLVAPSPPSLASSFSRRRRVRHPGAAESRGGICIFKLTRLCLQLSRTVLLPPPPPRCCCCRCWALQFYAATRVDRAPSPRTPFLSVSPPPPLLRTAVLSSVYRRFHHVIDSATVIVTVPMNSPRRGHRFSLESAPRKSAEARGFASRSRSFRRDITRSKNRPTFARRREEGTKGKKKDGNVNPPVLFASKVESAMSRGSGFN